MGLELIHADGQFRELEEIAFFERFDAEISALTDGSNDWMLELPETVWESSPIDKGHYIYIPGTEFGGPAERISHIGKDGTVRVYGTCWRGLLSRKIVVPPAGQTHLNINSTEANLALSQLLGGWKSDLFSVPDSSSGIYCSASLRYRTLIESIYMLLGSGGALHISYSGGRVSLSCRTVSDLSGSVELSQDYDAVLTSDSRCRMYDHIIALGQGEMLDRMVVELWLLPDGTVTDDPSAEGVPAASEQFTLLYDYPSVESRDELVRAAGKKLRGERGTDSLDMELYDYDGSLALGDIVSVRDNLTGMTASLGVTGINLRLEPDGMTVRHTFKQ